MLGWGNDGSQGDKPGPGTMANGRQRLAASLRKFGRYAFSVRVSFEMGVPGRYVWAAVVAVSVMGCSGPAAMPAPTLMPTLTPTPPVTTATARPPAPTPDPRDEWRYLTPAEPFSVKIQQHPGNRFPVLVVSHRSYNACTNGGQNRGRHRLEWGRGQVQVHVQQLVRIPPGGCPPNVGKLDIVRHTILLDQLTSGDEVFVNGDFWFHATTLTCSDYQYGNCPIGCVPACASSVCYGEPRICTADCGGENSCRFPDRKFTPEPHQQLIPDERPVEHRTIPDP